MRFLWRRWAWAIKVAAISATSRCRQGQRCEPGETEGPHDDLDGDGHQQAVRRRQRARDVLHLPSRQPKAVDWSRRRSVRAKGFRRQPSGMAFDGLRVLSLESRRAAEIERLIRGQGGVPFVAPSMREIPLEENPQAFDFAARLLQPGGDFDMVIFLTGVGARLLNQILETRYPPATFHRRLAPRRRGRARIEARGRDARVGRARSGLRS